MFDVNDPDYRQHKDELVAIVKESLLKGVLKAISPDLITSTEDRYDSGRFDERIRIRNAVLRIAVAHGVTIGPQTE